MAKKIRKRKEKTHNKGQKKIVTYLIVFPDVFSFFMTSLTQIARTTKLQHKQRIFGTFRRQYNTQDQKSSETFLCVYF